MNLTNSYSHWIASSSLQAPQKQSRMKTGSLKGTGSSTGCLGDQPRPVVSAVSPSFLVLKGCDVC